MDEVQGLQKIDLITNLVEMSLITKFGDVYMTSNFNLYQHYVPSFIPWSKVKNLNCKLHNNHKHFLIKHQTKHNMTTFTIKHLHLEL